MWAFCVREASGAIEFQYAKEWLDWESTFPVSLSLPLREERYHGVPVVSVFDNLLPDSASNRKCVSERVGADGTEPTVCTRPLARTASARCSFFPIPQTRARPVL